MEYFHKYGIISKNIKDFNIVLIFILILFFINPILSILFLGYVIHKLSSFGSLFNSLVILFSISFLSFINTTKVPETDLAIYIEWHEKAMTMNFMNYVMSQNKEYIYFIFDYIVSNLTNANEFFYKLFYTILIYFFFLYATLRFGKYIDLQPVAIYSCIVIIAFFPAIFAMSLHLVRQILAIGLSIYIFSKSIDKNQHRLLPLLIIPAFIHSSIFILIFCLILVNLLYKLNNLKRNKFTNFLLVILLILSFYFIKLIDELPYALNRVAEFTDVELNFIEQKISITEIFIGLMPVFCLLLLRKKIFSQLNDFIFLNKFCYAGVIVFLIALIINFRFNNFAQIGTRILLIEYIFMPLFISLFFKLIKNNKFIYKFIILFTPFCMIIYFFLLLYSSPWTYHFDNKILFYPFPFVSSLFII
jgi:hypothetical protein